MLLLHPYGGHYGQQKGFYKALSLALFLTGTISIINALPEDLFLFCLTNFAFGFCLACITPSLSAALASSTEHDQHGKAFGYMFAAEQFGSMLGPLLGGFMASYVALRVLFICCGIILLMVCARICMRRYREELLEILL